MFLLRALLHAQTRCARGHRSVAARVTEDGDVSAAVIVATIAIVIQLPDVHAAEVVTIMDVATAMLRGGVLPRGDLSPSDALHQHQLAAQYGLGTRAVAALTRHRHLHLRHASSLQ